MLKIVLKVVLKECLRVWENERIIVTQKIQRIENNFAERERERECERERESITDV